MKNKPIIFASLLSHMRVIQSPLTWFEFEVTIFLKARVFIEIGIYIGFIQITIFSLEKNFSLEIASFNFQPSLGDPCMSLNPTTGVLTLNTADFDNFDCTTLSGAPGNEEIECRCGDNLDVWFGPGKSRAVS